LLLWGKAEDDCASWRHPLICRFSPGRLAGVNPTLR
jgi:hypothetical protein